MNDQRYDKLFQALVTKATLKQDIYHNTLEAMNHFKEVISELGSDYESKEEELKTHRKIAFEYLFKSEFEVELKFGGDILLFLMHTNVFDFSRDHEVMRTPYIREDKTRSYCGIINVYNFLADSFKYNRYNDIGYLIGRIFINHEKHYFIEGKRELGFLYNDFGRHLMSRETAGQIVEAAMLYTINFDLLTPPYENVKLVTVNEMKNTLDTFSIKTGKRLGFQFQEDKPNNGH
jgi:hypothetical protein